MWILLFVFEPTKRYIYFASTGMNPVIIVLKIWKWNILPLKIFMQDYNTIIGSIQMRLNNCPTRSAMDRYNIGSGTLNLIMSRYKASGIPIEELRMMPPKDVEELFYPSKNLQRKDVPLPDFQYYCDFS